jgi:hypothetical protein
MFGFADPWLICRTPMLAVIAEIVAQFEQALPGYRVLKVVPPPNERAAKRRQTLTSGPPGGIDWLRGHARANASFML